MSLYNGLFEASKAMKAGFGDLKEKKALVQQMGMAAKQSEGAKVAGPALGKIAKFAAYPAGLGAGVGVGALAIGAGAGAGADMAGKGVKSGWSPENAKEAGKSLFGVILLLIFAGGAVYLYRVINHN